MPETVLILGATSDMAIATAEKFAAKGYNLFLAGRNKENMEPICSDLQIRFGIACSSFLFDAEAPGQHMAFWESMPETPAITICFIGYMKDNGLTIASQTETLKTLTINFSGLVSVLNIISAAYARQGKGTIIGVSSVAGIRGRQSNYIYGSAKAGFTAYLSGLRNKMYRHQVHVLTVLPGFVYTKMTAELKLPPLLTATPAMVASRIYSAMRRKKNIIYVKWHWRWIMLIIKMIPEGIFKKMKL